jgi:hypothetical protein
MPSVRSRAGRQHRLKTIFIRCPARDWARVTTGRQTEFRVAAGGLSSAYGFSTTLKLPLFGVLYRTRPELQKLMLIERIRRERLMEITEDGLARAGYGGNWEEAFPRFRRDWMTGEKKRFEPNRQVIVFTVRPPVHDDVQVVAMNLVNHFYGEHLAAAQL